MAALMEHLATHHNITLAPYDDEGATVSEKAALKHLCHPDEERTMSNPRTLKEILETPIAGNTYTFSAALRHVLNQTDATDSKRKVMKCLKELESLANTPEPQPQQDAELLAASRSALRLIGKIASDAPEYEVLREAIYRIDFPDAQPQQDAEPLPNPFNAPPLDTDAFESRGSKA